MKAAFFGVVTFCFLLVAAVFVYLGVTGHPHYIHGTISQQEPSSSLAGAAHTSAPRPESTYPDMQPQGSPAYTAAAPRESSGEAGTASAPKPAAVPARDGAGFRIVLKNGASFVAGSCRELGAGRLLCQKEDGAVELARADVLSIEVAAPSAAEAPASQEPEGRTAAGGVVREERGKGGGQHGPEAVAVTKEQAARLDELMRRRASMENERESLMSDREKLHQEVKDAGVIRSRAKFEELQKKISDMEVRVKDFNAGVGVLNREIEDITAQMQKGR